MARARNIKPSLFKNEILGTSDPMLTLLFISLWTLADRNGVLEDRPLRIRAETFPYRDVTHQEFNGYLTELERLGFILRYEAGGTALIHIRNFEKHQTPHNTEKAGAYPKPSPQAPVESDSCRVTVTPPLANGEITQAKRSDSLNIDSLNIDSLNTDSLRVVAPRDARTARAKGTRLPDQFSVTAQMVDWARSRAPAVNLSDETEKFRNYYQAATGPNAVRMDWAATWRNWILNAKEFNGNGKNRPNGGGKRTDADVFAESADFYANFPDAAVDHA